MKNLLERKPKLARFILPTAEIVRNFKEYEPLFSFYDEGLRGLVRDMVMLSDMHAAPEETRSTGFKRELGSDGLLEKVLRDYGHSLDAMFAHHIGVPNKAPFVGALVELIYQHVVEMMSAYFRREPYEVCKQQWEWLGSDVIVGISFLERDASDDSKLSYCRVRPGAASIRRFSVVHGSA